MVLGVIIISSYMPIPLLLDRFGYDHYFVLQTHPFVNLVVLDVISILSRIPILLFT